MTCRTFTSGGPNPNADRCSISKPAARTAATVSRLGWQPTCHASRGVTASSSRPLIRPTERTCSYNRTSPPRRRTRAASASVRACCGTMHSTSEKTTASASPSPSGSESPCPATTFTATDAEAAAAVAASRIVASGSTATTSVTSGGYNAKFGPCPAPTSTTRPDRPSSRRRRCARPPLRSADAAARMKKREARGFCSLARSSTTTPSSPARA